ncbi:acetylxylan esterase [Haloferula helveola]|uniref:Acetylxylan esterase n=1 Tax=Haloferula helveola TaxID=490095 RepID=A0ABM7RCH0_9BACT|nr:acetylxylan esterase [Haloferula helveola]
MKGSFQSLLATVLLAFPATCFAEEPTPETWEPDPKVVESWQGKFKDGKNFHDDRVPDYRLPDPLVSEAGKAITETEDWTNIRRPEILELFRKHVYGIRPTTPYQIDFEEVGRQENAYGIGAVARQVRATVTAEKGVRSFDFVLVTPKSGQPAPLIVMIHNRSAVTLENAVGEASSFWPVETLIRRGYATAGFHTSDVDPDEKSGYGKGIRSLLDANDSDPMTRWHTLSAWGWGASRVLDYALKQPGIDPERTAVVGHSRGGKTALWAGAEDPRFKLVYSNNSGCGGAALSRRAFGETVERINTSFPHWFNGNFKTYNGKEGELPVDQHQLIALIAPRPVYVTSRDRDLWADPRGEYTSVVQAGPVYGLFGLEHITDPEMPPLDTPLHIGSTGYHILTGKHNLDEQDWGHFLDFADGVFKRKTGEDPR